MLQLFSASESSLIHFSAPSFTTCSLDLVIMPQEVASTCISTKGQDCGEIRRLCDALVSCSW